MTGLPWITISLVGLSLAIAAIPGLQEALVFDRGAVSTGQVWRILGGHFVHLSPSHLVLNLVVFALGGALVEREDRTALASLCVLATLTIGVGLLVVTPGVDRYAGCSGIACSFLVFVCLRDLRDHSTSRWISIGMLAAISAKVALDAVSAHPLFARALPSRPFAPSSAAHVLGAASAIAQFRARGGKATVCTAPYSACTVFDRDSTRVPGPG